MKKSKCCCPANLSGLSAFGQAGEGYVRVSYAADMEKLVEAMKRLRNYISEH
ncbi:MAG: hypothetical protein LBF32_01790 [Streptococcaceae bacterium]|jgi:aminotransferase|nr:hypothetical protein [Streptococcaceae bacterium]